MDMEDECSYQKIIDVCGPLALLNCSKDDVTLEELSVRYKMTRTSTYTVSAQISSYTVSEAHEPDKHENPQGVSNQRCHVLKKPKTFFLVNWDGGFLPIASILRLPMSICS